MKPETAHSALRGLTLAAVSATVLGVPMAGRAQVPGMCTGTATFSQCEGNPITCGDYTQEGDCSFGRYYPQESPTYCTGWVPGTQNDCEYQGLKVCGTVFQCAWDAVHGTCYRPNWNSQSLFFHSDKCINPTLAPVPPPPQPNP